MDATLRMAPPRRARMADEEAVRELGRRDDVELEHSEDALERQVGLGAVQAEAGAVHENRDGLARTLRRGEHGLAPFRRPEVGGEKPRLDPVRPRDLFREPLEPVARAGDEEEVVALLREAAGQRLADSRGGAGDDRELPDPSRIPPRHADHFRHAVAEQSPEDARGSEEVEAGRRDGARQDGQDERRPVRGENGVRAEPVARAERRDVGLPIPSTRSEKSVSVSRVQR